MNPQDRSDLIRGTAICICLPILLYIACQQTCQDYRKAHPVVTTIRLGGGIFFTQLDGVVPLGPVTEVQSQATP